jgi:hypothetical protein
MSEPGSVSPRGAKAVRTSETTGQHVVAIIATSQMKRRGRRDKKARRSQAAAAAVSAQPAKSEYNIQAAIIAF